MTIKLSRGPAPKPEPIYKYDPIENTYKNKDVNTEQIFEKGFSTKQGNTGLGLWQIRQILKKNNNLNLYTSKDDEYFRQSLEIYNQ